MFCLTPSGVKLNDLERECGHSSKATAFFHFGEVIEELRIIRPMVVHIPTINQMDANRRAIFNKYHISGVIGRF